MAKFVQIGINIGNGVAELIYNNSAAPLTVENCQSVIDFMLKRIIALKGGK